MRHETHVRPLPCALSGRARQRAVLGPSLALAALATQLCNRAVAEIPRLVRSLAQPLVLHLVPLVALQPWPLVGAVRGLPLVPLTLKRA